MLNPNDYNDKLQYLIDYCERRKERITPYTKKGFTFNYGKPLTQLEREFHKGSLFFIDQILYELKNIKNMSRNGDEL